MSRPNEITGGEFEPDYDALRIQQLELLNWNYLSSTQRNADCSCRNKVCCSRPVPISMFSKRETVNNNIITLLHICVVLNMRIEAII